MHFQSAAAGRDGVAFYGRNTSRLRFCRDSDLADEEEEKRVEDGGQGRGRIRVRSFIRRALPISVGSSTALSVSWPLLSKRILVGNKFLRTAALLPVFINNSCADHLPNGSSASPLLLSRCRARSPRVISVAASCPAIIHSLLLRRMF